MELVMQGDLAAIGMAGGVTAYHLVAGDWVKGPPPGSGPSDYLRIDGGRILASKGEWSGYVAERNSSGTWTSTLLLGQPRGNDDEFWGGPLDILGDRVILGTPYTRDVEPQEIPIYTRGASGWSLYQSVSNLTHSWGGSSQIAQAGQATTLMSSGQRVLTSITQTQTQLNSAATQMQAAKTKLTFESSPKAK